MLMKVVSRCFLLVLLSSVISLAQGPTGSIDGIVADPSGAVLPGATVTLVNVATEVNRAVKTDQSGLYTFPALPPAVYNITVERAGFKTELKSNITLQVQQAARIDFSLSVGQISQTVSVAADAALLSLEDSTIGQVVENKRIEELPLNGRSYLQLAALSAGATNTSSPSSGSSMQGGSRGASSLTINGQRNDFNHYTLDGIENTDPNFNSYILQPSLDALQEFKIQSATYPSEYGWGVTQINVDTKSGSNQFHGSAFDFLRNSWFDAKNYFDNNAPIPSFRRNQFGGAFGGPILRKRLFFMGNYEGLRDSKGQTIITTVPSTAKLSGNFSGDSVPVYDPATRVTGPGGVITATPFPGNVIPSTRFSPTSVAYLQYYSAPNLPGTTNNHVNNESLTNSSDQTMLRVDYQMATTLSWFGRWNDDKDAQYTPGGFIHEGGLVATRPDQVLAGGIQIFGTHLINEERFGWSRFVNNLTGYNAFKNDINTTKLKIPGLNPTNNGAFWGIPADSITGYSGFGEPTTVYLTHNNIWEGHDTLSWTHGKHFVKFGGVYEPIHYSQTGNQDAIGSFSQYGDATGNPAVAGSIGDPVGDFLLGYVSFAQIGLQPANAALVSSYYAGFATDTFHITRDITIDYGVRYEYLRPFKDMNDASSNLGARDANPPVVVRASNQGQNLDPYAGLLARLVNITVVRDGSLGPSLVNPDRNNVAPRLGLSYALGQKTVIRAGIGTFYDMLDMGNSVYDMARTLAGFINASQTAATLNLSFSNPTGSTSSSTSTINVATPTILANDPNLRTTYINQWTLDVQRSISRSTVVDIAYVGSQGHRLKRETALNMPPTPGPGAVQSRRPWQYIGLVQNPASLGNSNYNAVQAKIEKQLSGGIALLSSYTFGKSIDNTSGVRPGAGENVFGNNPFSLGRLERGLSTYDVRSRWIASGLIESPYGAGKRYSGNGLENAILGSWQLSGIMTVQTGNPSTAYDGTDVPNIGNGSTPRPNTTGISPKISNPTPRKWFNPAAFAVNAPYTYGNASRNTVIGPGLVELDMSLMKSIPIGDRLSSQLRWDMFNVANHPIFGQPQTTLSSSSYTQISSTKVDSREMQISMRFVF